MECAYYKIDSKIRDEILNATLNEFSKKKYKDASTNEIVKHCSISKGTLFNYFKSKEELYFQTLNYSVYELASFYSNIFDDIEDDFIEAIKVSLKVKHTLIVKYPTMFQFLETCFKEVDSPSLERTKSIMFNSQVVQHQIRLSQFKIKNLKTGLNEEEIKQLIMDVLDGVTYKYMNNGLDIEQSFEICEQRLLLIENLIMEDR